MPSEPAGRESGPSEARPWEIVFPDHANHLGSLFGGQTLAWMDKAAFIAATRYARRTVVTARSEQVGALNRHGHVPLRHNWSNSSHGRSKPGAAPCAWRWNSTPRTRTLVSGNCVPAGTS